jgi:hypothetical protein
MARGIALDVVRAKLKAECGESPVANTEVDLELNQLIDNKQQWLVAEFDFPFMTFRWDVAVSGRYVTIPTLTIDGTTRLIDFDRHYNVEVRYLEKWEETRYGIGSEEYNTYDSDLGEANDPVRRWMFHGPGQIEVWPLPVTSQTIRFTGQSRPASLRMAGDETAEYDSGAPLDLDDLLVVYYCAAERLMRRNQRDAVAKLQLATERMRTIRAMYPSRERRVILGHAEDDDVQPIRTVPIIGTAGH